MAAVGAWLVPWAPYGRCEGVAGFLRPVWPLWGRGRSPGSRMVAVGAWPVLYAPYCRRGGVDSPWAPCGRRGGVTGPVGLVWPPWWRAFSLGTVCPT